MTPLLARRLALGAASIFAFGCALAGLAWSSWPLLAAAVAAASGVAWQITELPAGPSARNPTDSSHAVDPGDG